MRRASLNAGTGIGLLQASQPGSDHVQNLRVGWQAASSLWCSSFQFEAVGAPEMLLSRQLLLESDPLEFLTEMLDPIFRLLALTRRHESCYSVRAAGRAQHPVFRIVVNGGADLNLCGIASPSHMVSWSAKE